MRQPACTVPSVTELEPGLYESLITRELRAKLDALSGQLISADRRLNRADAADRIAWHVGKQVERSLLDVGDEDRVEVALEVARALLDRLGQVAGVAAADGSAHLAEPASVLEAILQRRPDGQPKDLDTPVIPLLDTTLLTNAPGEPRVGQPDAREIAIRRIASTSSWRSSAAAASRLLDALRAHCERGGRCACYDDVHRLDRGRALDQLAELGAEVRVSYDIGDDAAAREGVAVPSRLGLLDRVRRLVEPHALRAGHGPRVERPRLRRAQSRRDRQDRGGLRELLEQRRLRRRTTRERVRRGRDRGVAIGRTGDVIAQPDRARASSRSRSACSSRSRSRAQQGHHRNLLVAATGTGKTVMAAVDYARLRDAACHAPACSSSRTARRSSTRASRPSATRCATHAFGEMWVGGAAADAVRARLRLDPEPQRGRLDRLDADHFDVVIVDEFHHAAAPSYERCSITLAAGRAARADRDAGAQRRARRPALVRRPHRRRAAAVGRDRPAPPRAVRLLRHPRRPRPARDPWRRGRGLRRRGADERLHQRTTSGRASSSSRSSAASPTARTMRALGFCVSVEHARFMARVLQRARHRRGRGLGRQPATTSAQRRCATSRDGAVKVVFSVDLFNEGVDVPAVDTLLMLRPTDSPTLFLQQLGRGLRKTRARRVCTVLDFVGHAPQGVPLRPALPGAARRQRAATSSEQSRQGSRSCRPAATWSSTASRRRSCCEHPRGDPIAVAGEGRGAALAPQH